MLVTARQRLVAMWRLVSDDYEPALRSELARYGMTDHSESHVQSAVRLVAARKGMMLHRNNSGALRDQTGRLVRFGLGNDSTAINRALKSSDLIGWQTVTVTPDMVGQTVAVFTSIECKPEGWRLQPGDERAQAQLAWLRLVAAAGGYAGWAYRADGKIERVG